MTEQRREAEALRERDREAALRAWLNEETPDGVPPSLARTVASVTSRPHPAGGGRERGAVAWLPGSRVTLLRAIAALAAVAVVAVTTGLLATGLRSGPAASPSSVAPSGALGSASPSSVGLGTPRTLAVIPQPVSAITDSGAGAVVATWGEGVNIAAGAPPASCGGFPVGTVDANDAVSWTAAPFGWVEKMTRTADGSLLALTLAADCRTRSLERSTDNGRTWSSGSGQLTGPVDWFGTDPADPSQVAAWRWDGSKGGFISWLGPDGTWSTQTDEALPVGWDAAGSFWRIAPDGTLLRGRGPGFSAERTSVRLDATWSWQAGERPPVVTAIAGDRLLLGGTGRSLASVPLGQAGPLATTLSGFEALAFGVGASAVTAVGTLGGEPSVAVSGDGASWTTGDLPADLLAKGGAAGWAAAVVTRPPAAAVMLAGPTAAGTAIISVPVSGATGTLPTPGPTATNGPGQVAPSIPPAVATSTWTLVTDVPVGTTSGGGSTGGPAGFSVSAVPGGGFVAFVGSSGQPTRVLRSADGLHWSPLSTIPAATAAVPTGPLAWDGHTYVLMGSQGGGLSTYGSQSNGAAWVSPDLVHWTKAPEQAALGGIFGFGGLAAGPGGFVAVGTSQAEVDLWTSPDGLHWSSPSTGPFSMQAPDQAVAVFATSNGYLVAGTAVQGPAVFTSADGMSWVIHPLGASSGGLQQAVRFGSAFATLANGSVQVEVGPGDFRGSVVPWTSEDGIHWTAATSADALFGAYVSSMTAGPGGLVAAGWVLSGAPGAPTQAGALWTSRDGIHWDRVAGLDLGAAEQVGGVVSDGRHDVAWANGAMWVSDGVVR